MLYKTIIADPPWSYGGAGKTYQGAASNIYSTMHVSEICDMPVSKIAHPNSILLLWVTWPCMVEGLKVIDAWGFSYVTGFPWLKIKDISKDLWGRLAVRVRYGIGHWFRGCSEAILLARRGNVSPPYNHFSGILCSSLVHSRKPKNIYEYAETLDGPYLELFARSKRKGWTSWGNEVDTPEDPDLDAILHNKSLNPTLNSGRVS